MIQRHTPIRPPALVCVAALEDVTLLTRWETHLHPLQQAQLISVWSEPHLEAGTDRLLELRHQIDTADLVFLLLSADFFASPDCCALMEQALARSHSSTTRVIPLLVRPVAWQETPLGTLSPWPINKKPIVLWSNQDEGWDACVQELRRLLGRRISLALSSERSLHQADPDWDRMLGRLRRSYKELLDQSLHGIAWLELGLSSRPDLVSNVTTLLFRLPDGGERLLAPGTRVLDVYDEAEGELLILGTPGAGKSTLLLDLAYELIGRAQAAQLPFLPVILRLSSWADRRPALKDWMVEQLARTYDVPQHLSERWANEGRLLPLLDGLDEMDEAARPACIATINTYHRTHLAPLVVCSRHAEYEVAAKRERLALQSAVIVQALTDEQIEEYLSAAGSSFAGVRTALHQEHTLRELATTPLMLSVLLLTYRGTTASEIIQQGTDLERQVWTDYVARQVAEKGKATRYPLDQTRSILGWLAQQLQAHQQTTFYAEQLHIDWLSDTQQRRTATRLTMLIPAIVIGVCVALLLSIFILYATVPVLLLQMGTLGGFVGGCLSLSGTQEGAEIGLCLQRRTVYHLRNAMLLGGLLAASSGLWFLPANPANLDPGYILSSWLWEGCILGLGSALSIWAFQACINRVLTRHVLAPPMSLDLRSRLLRWMHMMGSPHIWQAAAILGGGIGLSYGLIYGLRYKLSVEPSYGLSAGLSAGLTAGLSIWLSVMVSVSISVVLVHLILAAALNTFRFAERIHWTGVSLFQPRHLRATAIMTATILLFFGVIYGLLTGLIAGLVAGLGFGLGFGLSYGLSVGFIYWVVLGLYQGMKQEHLDDQSRSQFNQGIQRSLRNGVLISLISAIITTLMSKPSTELSFGLRYGLRDGLLIGLTHGVSFGLRYGLRIGLSSGLHEGQRIGLREELFVLVAGMVVMWSLSGGLTILRHYVIRWLLARHRTFPFRAQAFLDDATTRILLRRVGGGYSFIHRRLQDYFANKE